MEGRDRDKEKERKGEKEIERRDGTKHTQYTNSPRKLDE